MTYQPGSPGYPPAQSPGSYPASSTTSFAKSDDGESNLERYLTIGVVALGLAVYLLSFGDLFSVTSDEGQVVSALVGGREYAVVPALLAALLAGVGLLPKAKNYLGVVAAISVLGALEVITFATNKPTGLTVAWALWLILAFAVIQAILAVIALLLDAGVITPPAPRPKYDQYGQYGQYGGYYGQQPYQQSPQQSGYGAQYGGGYPSGPSTGGFSSPAPQSAPQHGQQPGSPTPPTGFPSFSPPPSSGSGGPGQGNSANHADSGPTQQFYGQGQQPPASSSPSGPSQS
jgi:Family of unknown function (DUF5336)